MSVKVALITGAACGLGKAIANSFLRNNYRVVLWDRQAGALDKTVREFQNNYGYDSVASRCLDLNAPDVKLDRMVYEMLRDEATLDVLVNNAGVVNELDIDSAINLNLSVLAKLSNVAGDIMSEQKTGGVVLNVASLSAVHPMSFAPIYSATKSAVLGFTESLQAQFNLRYFKEKSIGRVRFGCILPTFIFGTSMTNPSSVNSNIPEGQAIYSTMLSKQLVDQKALLRVEDVANEVAGMGFALAAYDQREFYFENSIKFILPESSQRPGFYDFNMERLKHIQAALNATGRAKQPHANICQIKFLPSISGRSESKI